MAAIALPIRHAGRVKGALNLAFTAHAMSVADPAQRYLERLQAAVIRIEACLAAPQARSMPAIETEARCVTSC